MSTLYIVSTPIGNLEDITFRAIRILKEVDAIVCEDTRHTRTLLDHFQIKKPLYSLHERSSEKEYDFIVTKLLEGKNLAYVTDAGTPGIADPGGRLVSCAVGTQHIVPLREERMEVIPIPGPSSLSAAISISGFNMQEFRFFGFLPHKKGRQKKIKEIIASGYPVVLFESKYRITKLLEELIQFGIQKDCQIVAANDLTKKFERIYRGTTEEVLKEIKSEEPKGEFVVIISANS